MYMWSVFVRIHHSRVVHDAVEHLQFSVKSAQGGSYFSYGPNWNHIMHVLSYEILKVDKVCVLLHGIHSLQSG
jgi:hypothetical protein